MSDLHIAFTTNNRKTVCGLFVPEEDTTSDTSKASCPNCMEWLARATSKPVDKPQEKAETTKCGNPDCKGEHKIAVHERSLFFEFQHSNGTDKLDVLPGMDSFLVDLATMARAMSLYKETDSVIYVYSTYTELADSILYSQIKELEFVINKDGTLTTYAEKSN